MWGSVLTSLDSNVVNKPQDFVSCGVFSMLMILRIRECEMERIKLDNLLWLSHGNVSYVRCIHRLPHSSLDIIIVVPLSKAGIKVVTGVCEGFVGL